MIPRLFNYIKYDIQEEDIVFTDEKRNVLIKYGKNNELVYLIENLDKGYELGYLYNILLDKFPNVSFGEYKNVLSVLENDKLLNYLEQPTKYEELYDYRVNRILQYKHLKGYEPIFYNLKKRGFNHLLHFLKILKEIDEQHPGFKEYEEETINIIKASLSEVDLQYINNFENLPEMIFQEILTKRMLTPYFLMLLSGSFSDINKNVVITGLPLIEQLNNEGGILLFQHYGAYELGISALLSLGYNLTVVADENEIEGCNSFSSIGREIKNEYIKVPDEFVLLKCFRSLKEKKIVTIAADHSTSTNRPSKYSVNFLGKQIFIPEGPYILAERSGCKIVYITTILKDDKLYIEFESNINNSSTINESIKHTFDYFENKIRLNPEYWSGASNFKQFMLSKSLKERVN